MTALQYVWLYDEKGNQPINPFFLSTLDHLVNDPYRSLAWMARRQGAYNKDVVSYQELIWANFFRDNVPFNSSTTPYTVDPVNWNWFIFVSYKLIYKVSSCSIFILRM